MSKSLPIELCTGHRTKEEIQERKELQEKIKGSNDKIEPTQKLNENQNRIFESIKEELKESGVLSNLDSYLLTQCSIALDKLEYLDSLAENKPGLILNKEFKSSKKLYFDIFIKCCNELAMSPSARAKVVNLKLQNKDKEEDPLLKALRDD